MRTLARQSIRVQQETAAALNLIAQLRAITTNIPRQYIAELIVVRLFSLFETSVEDCACRIVCGFQYCDGSAAPLTRPTPTRGLDKAREAMRVYNRTKPRNELRWSRARDISANLEMLFDPNEHFTSTLLGHGGFISDLRKVRNHIAHGNDGTYTKFQEVVSNYYGAGVHGLTPGKMLLSSRFKPTLVEQFCITTGVVLRTAIKASSQSKTSE